MSEYTQKIAKEKAEAANRGFFRVADFEGGKEKTLVIDCLLQNQMVFEGQKDVLYFTNSGKQLVVNLTNADVLINSFGDDPALWSGHRVTFYLHEYRPGKFGVRLKSADGHAGNGASGTRNISAANRVARRSETTLCLSREEGVLGGSHVTARL